jgi:hypothetical protein
MHGKQGLRLPTFKPCVIHVIVIVVIEALTVVVLADETVKV